MTFFVEMGEFLAVRQRAGNSPSHGRPVARPGPQRGTTFNSTCTRRGSPGGRFEGGWSVVLELGLAKADAYPGTSPRLIGPVQGKRSSRS
jgi:hypothetical protein